MSFIGVQKNSVHERDFKKGKAYQFIIAGALATLLFILCIYTLVQFILYLAGVN